MDAQGLAKGHTMCLEKTRNREKLKPGVPITSGLISLVDENFD